MVREFADGLRSLLVVWLLVTLPMVCHQETAVLVVGALTAGHDHPHANARGTDQHVGHLAAYRTSHHGTPAAAASPATLAAETNTHGATPHTHGLPQGQDGQVAVPVREVVQATAATAVDKLATATSPNTPLRPPPAPPPRVTA